MAAGRLGLLLFIFVAAALQTPASCARQKKPWIYYTRAYLGLCAGVRKPNGNAFYNITTSSSFNPRRPLFADLNMSGHMNVVQNVTDLKVTGKVLGCVMGCTKKLSVTEYPGFCDNVKEEGFIWSNITRSSPDFPSKCPITVGDFKFEDAPVNFDSFILDQNISQFFNPNELELTFSSAGAEFACIRFRFVYNDY